LAVGDEITGTLHLDPQTPPSFSSPYEVDYPDAGTLTINLPEGQRIEPVRFVYSLVGDFWEAQGPIGPPGQDYMTVVNPGTNGSILPPLSGATAISVSVIQYILDPTQPIIWANGAGAQDTGSLIQTGASDYAFDATVTNTFLQIAAPLPGALPLFATGIGALGLLGWRRKRKAQAI
jgi:hypothetical protein